MFVEDRTIERDGRVHTYLSTIKNKSDKTTVDYSKAKTQT